MPEVWSISPACDCLRARARIVTGASCCAPRSRSGLTLPGARMRALPPAPMFSSTLAAATSCHCCDTLFRSRASGVAPPLMEGRAQSWWRVRALGCSLSDAVFSSTPRLRISGAARCMRCAARCSRKVPRTISSSRGSHAVSPAPSPAGAFFASPTWSTSGSMSAMATRSSDG
jgi:hypothetical protein